MKILSEQQMEKLIENGKKIKVGFKGEIPVVAFLKLSGSGWMLASVDPDNHDKAYGLMEIAGGPPELGYVSLEELEGLTGFNDNKISHDPMFEHADKLDIHKYAKMAKQIGQISLRMTERITKDDLQGLID
ncbi:DUF2958 domain-containing protein [Reichenbachiella sp.]|uniref:DUF2958 domain-containing protein n=1 Tax=Reichenbachiella sp. TaxID=2184521 RepID=UPI0032993247